MNIKSQENDLAIQNNTLLNLLHFNQLLLKHNITENKAKSILLRLISWKGNISDSLQLAQKLIDDNPKIINATDENNSTPLINAARMYNEAQNISEYILKSDKWVLFLLLNQANISILLKKNDTQEGESLRANLYSGCSQLMKYLIKLMKSTQQPTLPQSMLDLFQKQKQITIAFIQTASKKEIQSAICKLYWQLITEQKEQEEQVEREKQAKQSYPVQKEIMKIITDIQKNRDNSFFSCMFKPNIKKSLIDLMNQALANGPIETTIFEKNLAKLFENTGYLTTHSTLSKKFKEYVSENPKNIDLVAYLQLSGQPSQANLRDRFNVTQEYKFLKDTKNTDHKTYFQQLI